MSFSIGGLTVPGNFTLAPMAGVTDYAFRHICREYGAAMTTTEMVSSRGLLYNDQKTAELLKLGEDEHPAAAQIFGNCPEIMAEAAVRAVELSGADILDINMGCPTPKITGIGRSGGQNGIGDGSALMKDPALAAAVTEAVVKAVRVPVTVKMRLGWDSVTAPEFAKAIEAAGASAVTVHGRTREQYYSGKADRGAIAKVVSAVQIPVIANGDIFTAEDGAAVLSETGAAACMIGRGCMGDPWLFARCEAALRGESLPMPSLRDKLGAALRQAELAVEDKGERVALREFRHHLAWYVKGVPGAAAWRARINTVSDWQTLLDLTDEIRKTDERSQ